MKWTQTKKRRRVTWRSKGLGFLAGLLLASSFSLGEGAKEEYAVSSSQPFKLSGYSQIRYSQFFDEGTDGFSLRRVRLSLAGEIVKNVSYKIQFEGTKTPVLLDAMVEFGLSREVTLRIGQSKVPFSHESLLSASEVDTINRAQVVDKLSPGRDIGATGRDIGALGRVKFSNLECTLGIFNGSGINKSDTNDEKDIAARVVFSPFRSLSVGASFYDGKDSPSAGAVPVSRDRTGIEFVFLQSALSLKGEYIAATNGPLKADGWYLQAGYFLISKKLQGIVKYDTYDKNRDISSDRSRVLIFGLNLFFSEKTKLMVNYEHGRLEAGDTRQRALLAQFQAGF